MPNHLKNVASFPLAVVLVAYHAADAVFGPLVRPAIAWASSLRLFTRIGETIAAMPPYAVLATLAVPFAVIEPFKFISLYWIASGHAVFGVVALVLSHLASLLICERIFHAGKARLLEIGWFARATPSSSTCATARSPGCATPRSGARRRRSAPVSGCRSEPRLAAEA